MLQAAAVFFIIAIIAAIFGFGGIAAGATQIAKILFFLFLIFVDFRLTPANRISIHGTSRREIPDKKLMFIFKTLNFAHIMNRAL